MADSRSFIYVLTRGGKQLINQSDRHGARDFLVSGKAERIGKDAARVLEHVGSRVLDESQDTSTGMAERPAEI